MAIENGAYDLCSHGKDREHEVCPKCTRVCRHCGSLQYEHGDGRKCPTGETSFWPVGEPGGG